MSLMCEYREVKTYLFYLEKKEGIMKKLEKKQLIVVAFTFASLLLIGGTYAYFSINATSDKTGAKVTGKANNLGNPAMQIKTSKLYLNLDANLMSQANAGKTYYANENENGLALETNPNYTLATAQLPEGDEALDCTYNYKVTATVTNEITDNSDSDVKVVVGDKTMTLKELTTAGTNGIIVSGEIKNLTKGNSVSIPLTSSVTNTANTQDKLVGNSYTIKIEPYTSGDTKAFSCKLRYKIDTTKTLAQNLIDSGWLWQSGLEGDGYRYTGSGAVGTDTNPNNFICFGTNNKSECTVNQDKYMYRVLGVFSDANGNNHVKLIKYKQLISTTWNSTNADVNWEDSTLYASLNGSGFLTNTTYDYLQNTEWSNRIENWTWSAVNTKTFDGSNGPNYYNSLTPSQIYLHELNRSTKTSTVGEWTNPVAKIGLMYASDYTLSLGSSALAITGSTSANKATLKTGWMHQSNNDTNMSTEEWTINRIGNNGSALFLAWSIHSGGPIYSVPLREMFMLGVRPVFYLTTDTKISDGYGSLENPFIIES